MHQVRVILQARTTSSRLPAKVLLPVGGMPLAVLCAKRLGRSELDVALATSVESSDDQLAVEAKREGIMVVRGSLNNVLARFLFATEDMNDTDCIVRMTADNPVPDASFVGELIAEFSRRNQCYLGTSSPQDGLPYGLSAEIVRLGKLREVASMNPSPNDCEHVTASIREQLGKDGAIPQGFFFGEDLSRYRVTIDSLDDYLLMAAGFRHIADPVNENWKSILESTISRSSAGSGAC